MAMEKGREYRALQDFALVPREGEADVYRVRGTAVVFDTPACLYEIDGVKYYEVIDRKAFDNCDLSDVIMNYNHSGKVVARVRNKTLSLHITEHGLELGADLSGTAAGRELYEEIDGGYIDKMSFSFSVRASEYDTATHTRTITKIRRLYDVAAVDIPAYQETSISARSFFEEEELEKLERELDLLDSEEATIARREEAVDRINRSGKPGGSGDSGGGNTTGHIDPIMGRGGIPADADSRAARLAILQGVTVQEAEERARSFASGGRMEITTEALKRSLTLTSGNIAQPTRVSGINAGQNIVSGIVDMVRVVDADGMGEDSVAYEVSGGQMAVTKKDDGTAATTMDPILCVAKITPTMISTLSYVSANIQRTTPLNYQSRVTEGALNALRKKTGAMIVTGDPAATITEPTGILKAAAISDSSDLTIEKINEKTLRDIALKYGGANNVEGGGVLLLNKKDLIAFGDVRGANEKKAVYEIEFSENSTTTGTIKDGGLAVKFCIVDELPAISAASTAAGSYCMAYGKPLAYQLDLFGPYEVKVSEDYKFGEGLLAVRGTAMIGGNVVTENGFIRVKNKA